MVDMIDMDIVDMDMVNMNMVDMVDMALSLRSGHGPFIQQNTGAPDMWQKVGM